MKLRCPECGSTAGFKCRVTVYSTWFVDDRGHLVDEDEESRSIVWPDRLTEYRCEDCGFDFTPDEED